MTVDEFVGLVDKMSDYEQEKFRPVIKVCRMLEALMAWYGPDNVVAQEINLVLSRKLEKYGSLIKTVLNLRQSNDDKFTKALETLPTNRFFKA